MYEYVPATPTLYGQAALDLIAYLNRDATPKEIEDAKRSEETFKTIKFVRH